MGSTVGRHSSSGWIALVVIVLLFFHLDDYEEFVSGEIAETQFCEHYVRSKGYLCEEHKTYTSDGFGLVLHRVGKQTFQPSSQGESESGSKFSEHPGSTLKVTHEAKRKGWSGSAPAEKSADFIESTDNLAAFMGGSQFEQPRPYQLVQAKPDSIADRRRRSPGAASKWLDGDAEDSPENLPPTLPPYSKAANPTIVQLAVSAPQITFPVVAPVSSAAVPAAETPISTQAPAQQPESTSLLAATQRSDFYTNAVPQTTETAGSPPSPVNPVDIPYSSELTPASVFENPVPSAFSPESSSAPIYPASPVVPQDIFSPVATPSSTIASGVELSSAAAPDSEYGGASPGQTFDASPTYSTLNAPNSAQTPDLGGNSDYTAPPTPLPAAAAVPPSQISAPGPVSCSDVTGDCQGLQGDSGKSVLLMHPELLNGDSWFKAVDDQGNSPFLPFILAEEGFDVWIGHERATYWSHDHLQLDSSNHDYWNWTLDDLAEKDLPTTLGYINAKMQTKIHVVGVSQSAAVGAATATQPAVAQFIKSLTLLGPTIYRGGPSSPLMQTIFAGIFAQIAEGAKVSLLPVSGPLNFSREFGIPSVFLGGPASVVSGPDCCINTIVTLFDNGWDGTTSYKNFQHFVQGIVTNTFQHFDYGSAALNSDVYGQPQPPSYSPWNIPVDLPVMIIYGGQDYFSPPEGIQELLSVMQRAPATVFLALYSHLDLFFSSSRNEDVYSPIRSFLQGTYTVAGTETNAPSAG